MSSRGVLIATDSIDSMDIQMVESFNARSPKTPPLRLNISGEIDSLGSGSGNTTPCLVICKCFTDKKLSKCTCKYGG